MTKKLHFFSYETKVSLELPVGWEELEEDIGLAIYGDELDDEAEEVEIGKLDPKLTLKTFAISTSEPEAFKKIADQTLNVPKKNQQVLQRKIREVDSYPASVDLFTYEDEEIGGAIAQYQVFVQIADVICSITGIVDLQDQEEYFPVFEEAVQSIRFILV